LGYKYKIQSLSNGRISNIRGGVGSKINVQTYLQAMLSPNDLVVLIYERLNFMDLNFNNHSRNQILT